MEIQEFLAKLLAECDDYFVLWVKTPKSHYNYSTRDLSDLCTEISRIDKSVNTVYFAIGKHSVYESRKAETACHFKTLAYDVDVEPGNPKKYPTQQDALRGILTTYQSAGLPQPMLVSSGYGWHVYHPLTRTIDKPHWLQLSTALRHVLINSGLKIDTTKINEASMVLRPIGTHNKKDENNWKPVELKQDADPIDPDILAGIFGVTQSTTSASRPSIHINSGVSNALLQHNDAEINPVPLDKVARCAQIAALLASGGADASEPLWRGSLGIAKHCLDPQGAIEALAGQYPGFSLEENLSKMEHWNAGPTTCAYFEQHNPETCVNCKYAGHIKSPITLGTTSGDDLDDIQIRGIHFPSYYKWTGSALVFQSPGMENSELISRNLIYVLEQFADEDFKATVVKLGIKYKVEGWREVDVPHTALSSDSKEFNDFMSANQIWLPGGQLKKLRNYIVSYLRELKERQASKSLYDHYGWQPNGSFLLGTELLTPTGKETIQFNKLAQQFNENLQPKGDLSKWIDATKMFAIPELRYHGFAFLVGLSGPLTLASGMSGLLVNMYSPHSGSGKTLTGSFVLSAWGNPEKLFLTTRDTDNAIYKTLGTLQNLSAYIDEITMIDGERLRGFLQALPQGVERKRGTQLMKELQLGATWSMPVLSSSNQDLYALTGMRLSSQGDIARILQIPLHRVDIFSKGGTNLGYQVSRIITNNYGLAGGVLVAEIMKRGGLEWAKEEYHNSLASFTTRYGEEFTGPERFIQAGFVCADITGRLCMDLGLIKFDAEEMIKRALTEYRSHKTEELKAELSGSELINQYLTEHIDKIVFVIDKRDSKTVSFKEPLPRVAVARMEVAYSGGKFIGGNLYINRASFRKWCFDMGLEYIQLLSQLTDQGAKYNDAAKSSLFRGVAGMGGVGQTRCLLIDLGSSVAFAEGAVNFVEHKPNIDVTLRIQEVQNA